MQAIHSSTYKVRMVQMMSWVHELVYGVLQLGLELAQRVFQLVRELGYGALALVHDELELGYVVQDQDFFLKLGCDVQQSLVPPLKHVLEQVPRELPQLRCGVLVVLHGVLVLSLVHDEWWSSLVHEIARNVMGYRVVLYVLALANDVLMIFFQNALRQVQNYYVDYLHGYGGPL